MSFCTGVAVYLAHVTFILTWLKYSSPLKEERDNVTLKESQNQQMKCLLARNES